LLAMQVISTEVIKSNRYGWLAQSPSTLIGPYVPGGPEYNCISFNKYLVLGGVDSSSQLYLRQDTNVGTGNYTPETYWDDEIVLIFWDSNNNEIRIDRDAGGNVSNTPGSGWLLASNVDNLEFRRDRFNSVDVAMTIRGDIPDPFGGVTHPQYNEINLRTKVTLRCAPAVTCEPENITTGVW